jgi:hypothetical protein
MSNAYQVTFECPKGGHGISLQRRSCKPNLSEAEARKMFVGEEISCEQHNCGWHGKASRLKLLRIVPFDWILSRIA